MRGKEATKKRRKIKTQIGPWQSQFHNAYQAAFEAVESNPESSETWYRLGQVTEDLTWEAFDSSYDEGHQFLFSAVCVYAQSAGRDPSWWEPYYRAGVLWETLGRPDKALTYSALALRKGNPHLKAHKSWIEIMVRVERFEEVVALYQAQNTSKPFHVWPYLYLGYAYQCQGYGLLDRELLFWAHRNDMGDAREKVPSNVRERLRKVRELLSLALGHYRLGAEKFPWRPEPYYYMGSLLIDPLVGTHKEAGFALRTALELTPSDHPLWKPIVEVLGSLRLRDEGEEEQG